MSLKADTIVILAILAIGAGWLVWMRFNTGGQESPRGAAKRKLESDPE